MATLTHAESRRLYSWWWEGHTAPKNSKWLQENLKDTDIKVKAMIKLLEGDADSFARRAEMYYKKRPELMKLVEEFYRAYRALAERYDHATGALRQAHRTMAEAFPNQIPFVITDEPPYGSLATEAASHTPEMSPTIHALVDSNDSQKDALRMSSQYHGIKRNGAYSEENDALMSKKGLKQLNEMFGGEEEVTHAKSSERRVLKGLKFQDEEENIEFKTLREEIFQLSKGNQNLKSQTTSESARADKSEAEVQSLNETISKVNFEKEAASLQHQISLERISTLETEISHSREDLKKLNGEMLMLAEKLNTGEERYLRLEKANESLQMELDRLKQKAQDQQEELSKKQEELEKLKLLLEEEHQRFMQADTARLSLEKLHSLSQEQERLLALEIQAGNEKLKDIEMRRKVLEEELQKIKEENGILNEQHLTSASKIITLQDEVLSLKETISKLNSEEESVALRHQLLLERISTLETEISHSNEDLNKLNDEMMMASAKLRIGEERCLMLETTNESLQLELDRLKHKAQGQQEELIKKQEELDKLNLLLEEEHQRFMQAETARLSLEKLHSQSQEQETLLFLDIQAKTEKLKDIELRRVVLEEELHKIKEENGSLNEQHLTSALKIINLQDEIVVFKASNMKLDDEVRLVTEKNIALQQELSCLKESRNDLEQSYHRLIEQVEAAKFNVDTLQAVAKELQSGNTELKEICNKHENEKVIHLANLKHMEKISEKNVVLENSLSDANVEIESLREMIKALEHSCGLLGDEISLHLTEKAMLVSQVESISQDMEKLTAKNVFLENSLSDVNVELEDLRGKLKVSEESCQSLSAQNSSLLSEKSTLVSQVEGTIHILEDLEARFIELEDKHFNLENEKDMTFHQVMELEDLLKREKEEYETLILSIMLSSNSQLSTLENQICLMQEEVRLRDEEFDVQQIQFMDAEIEIFILQRSLCDMNEKNSIISLESQKLLEASKVAEQLISELEEELLLQDKKLTISEERNEKLSDGIQLMLRQLCISQDPGSFDGITDEMLLQLTLHEIKDLLNSFSYAKDETQRLLLEKSVVITILEQFGLNMMDLTMDKNTLERESRIKSEELLVFQSKEQELQEMNEQLMQDLQASNQKHGELKSDMDVLHRQLMDLRVVHNTLQGEICKLFEENNSLTKKLKVLREERDTLEEENSNIVAEAMILEQLSLLYSSASVEKVVEIQLMSDDLAYLHGVTNELNEEIRLLTEKLVAVEVENVCLKEPVVNFYECRRHLMILENELNTTRSVCGKLDLENESGKIHLEQKDIELLQANQKLLSAQDKISGLCRNLEGLQLDIDGVMVVRKELEDKVSSLSEDNAQREVEISSLRQENGMLNWELDRLQKQVEDLRSREEHLTFELQKEVTEVNCCEVEIATFLKGIQIATVKEALFEEKVFELLITCESLEISAIVQREGLYEEIAIRNANVVELNEKLGSMEGENRGLKEELKLHLLLVADLWDDISSLEQDILSLADCYVSDHQGEQGNQMVSLHHSKSSQEPGEYHNPTAPEGILELQKLQAKVKALKKVMIDTESLLKQETCESSARLEAALKEVEVLKAKGNSIQEEKISKDIMQLENGDERDIDAGTSILKHEQKVKDIQLDLVLSSTYYGSNVGPYGESMMDNVGTSMEYHPIAAIEEERRCPSSELAIERELSIDKQELPKKFSESRQEWSGRTIGRLSSDARRLSELQTSLQELKRNMEASDMSSCHTSFEYDSIKAQLQEAEGSISQLMDINSKLTEKAEASSVSPFQGENEMQSKSQRKISEFARRGSEKIRVLELELQKIQYIFLKLGEEQGSKKGRATDGRKVLLRDYIYGRMDSRRRKRRACGCMRPKTMDD